VVDLRKLHIGRPVVWNRLAAVGDVPI